MMMVRQWQSVDEIRWDEFVNHVENKHIDSVTIKDTEVIGKFNEQGLASRGGKGKVSFVVYYKSEIQGEWLGELLKQMKEAFLDQMMLVKHGFAPMMNAN